MSSTTSASTYGAYITRLRQEEKRVREFMQKGKTFREFVLSEEGPPMEAAVSELFSKLNKYYDKHVVDSEFVHDPYARYPTYSLEPTKTLTWMPLRNTSELWHPSITPKDNKGGFHVTPPPRWRPRPKNVNTESEVRQFAIDRIVAWQGNKFFRQVLKSKGLVRADMPEVSVAELEAMSTDELLSFVPGFGGKGKFRIMLDAKGRPRPEKHADGELFHLLEKDLLMNSQKIYDLIGEFVRHIGRGKRVWDRASNETTTFGPSRDVRSAPLT